VAGFFYVCSTDAIRHFALHQLEVFVCREVMLHTEEYCVIGKGGHMHPGDISKIEGEVLAAFGGLVDASKALDSARYFACFDKEKFTGLNADGKVWHSIKDLERLVVPGFLMVEKSISLEFKNVKVTAIDPTTAILVNEYQQTMLLKSGSVAKRAGGGVQVWHQSAGAWKLVSFSASDATPP
jgi:hypothetical protein